MVNPTKVKKVVLSSTVAGMMLTAPMTGYAALGDQTLRPGMSHSDVKELQELLREKGYFTYHTSTGYFGSITKQAVMDFQRHAKIRVDGIVGPQTFQALKVTYSRGKQTSNASATPLLRLGSRGQAVTELQNMLKREGLYRYQIDGIFGSRTEQAVRQFQQKNKLLIDGIVGPQTWAALNGVESQPDKPTQASPPKHSSNPVLRLGARGEAVKELQKKLKEAGVYPYAVDGLFGQQTLSAVKSFQLQQGLAVDGVVGPKTWEKLKSPDKNKSGGSNSGSTRLNVIQLVADASKLMGVPYVWGGTTPSGFDCSGFIVYVFKKQGVHLPRTVAEQWKVGKKVSKPSVGDVVFFETYKPGPSHNGIYVGNNQFIHAGSSTGVTVSNMNSSYWKSRYLGARQLH